MNAQEHHSIQQLDIQVISYLLGHPLWKSESNHLTPRRMNAQSFGVTALYILDYALLDYASIE